MEDKTNDRLTMEFLLHKEKKKGLTHIQAHSVFADTQPNSEKPKEPSFS
ncbi:MAG: hypothetical protein PHZ24_02075 [Bacteroidales bacterium]|nr:hypothetical protein [Bacteroidales bacterium]